MSNDFLPYLFPFFFVGMWLAVTTQLRNLSGMAKRLDVATGVPLRSSGWGSASVNGVPANGCVKLEEHPDGFVIRVMWVFGGGRLWLPKAGLQIGDQRPKRLFVPRSRTLISGINQDILYDRLVDFVPGMSETGLPQ